MDAIGLIQPGITGHALQEKRIERNARPRSQPLEHGAKRIAIIGAEVRRRQHPTQQHRNSARHQRIQDGAQIRLGIARIKAAQPVIAAQLHQRRIHRLGQHPVQPRPPARRGVAGHRAIDQHHLQPARPQPGEQPRLEPVPSRQPIAGRQRIPQHQQPQRRRMRRPGDENSANQCNHGFAPRQTRPISCGHGHLPSLSHDCPLGRTPGHLPPYE